MQSGELTDLPPAVPQFSYMLKNIPVGTNLFGELYVANGPATDVITALNDKWDSLKFCGFAMPFYEGNDLIEMNLLQVNSIMNSISVETPVTIPTKERNKWTEEALLQRAIDSGYEGWVLKESHMSGWYKIKPVKTVDVVVTEWWMGNSQFFGELGALGVSVYTANGTLRYLGKVGGGYTPEQRKEFTRDKIMGKVIEVSYQDIQIAGGKLQFPRFMRIREDKLPAQCKEEQLPGLKDPWIQAMLDEQKRREQ